MTTVAALALAAATLARSANVGVAAALAGWLIIVLAGTIPTQDLATTVVQEDLIPAYAVGTLACLGVALYVTSHGTSGGRQWL